MPRARPRTYRCGYHEKSLRTRIAAFVVLVFSPSISTLLTLCDARQPIIAQRRIDAQETITSVQPQGSEDIRIEAANSTTDAADPDPDKHSSLPSYCPADPFVRYARLHRDILEGRADRRFLVYRPYQVCGMGNRLSGFSGFLSLAMMTDRAFLVDWEGGQRTIKAGKFENNFLTTNSIDYDAFPEDLRKYESLEGTQIWCQFDASALKTPCTEDRMTAKFLGSAPWDDIYASDTQVIVAQAHNNNPWRFLDVNGDAAVRKAVEKFNAELDPSVYRLCSLRYLFRPLQTFRDRYCAERSVVLGGRFATVGLHVRTTDGNGFHPEWTRDLSTDVEHFVECATGLEEGIVAIASELAEPSIPLSDTVWLLGTDNNDIIEILKQGNHTLAMGGKVDFIEGGAHHRSHSGAKGGGVSNEGPLLDLVMLSEATVIVGSFHSTFSIGAGDLGGVPWPLRLQIRTPFARIWGKQAVAENIFKTPTTYADYRQGCRDFITDVSLRDDLERAMQASLEPFIECDAD